MTAAFARLEGELGQGGMATVAPLGGVGSRALS